MEDFQISKDRLCEVMMTMLNAFLKNCATGKDTDIPEMIMANVVLSAKFLHDTGNFKTTDDMVGFYRDILQSSDLDDLEIEQLPVN